MGQVTRDCILRYGNLINLIVKVSFLLSSFYFLLKIVDLDRYHFAF